ncbi:monocarboxylate transporter 9-like [Haliotis rufescens]|uniref:monocarboxylate transporter 9-like n=1 Tax=Haliotis rufescens TaxID=6454 RepID=UPI00201ED180|nr:monocarboxylate transporter 9-like [Haliotis rufescens]
MPQEDAGITEDSSLSQHKQDGADEVEQVNVDNDAGHDGVDGWVVVFSSFGIHAIFHGLALSFGVIFAELVDYFNTGRGETAWVGSIVFGVQSVSGPAAGILTDKYGCRTVTICGAAIAAFGLITSSFASSISVLYFTYGVVFGIAFALVSVPSKVIVNQHMKQRRSLANCVSSSGSGIGGAALSAGLHHLSNTYGWRGMILITASILLNGVVFGGLFFPKKHRKAAQGRFITDSLWHCVGELLFIVQSVEWCYIAVRPKSGLRRSCCQNDFTKLVGNIQFCFFLMSNCLAMIAVYTPYTHLPKRATDLKIKETEISWLLPIIGIASVVGKLFFGWLGDFKLVNNRHLLASAVMMCGICAIATPFLTTFPMLVGFAVVFGVFIGVFFGTRNVVLVDVVGVENFSKSYGILLLSQGVSTLIGTPMTGWIYDATSEYSASFFTVGSMFLASSVILFLQEKVEIMWRQRKHDQNQTISTLTVPTPLEILLVNS